MAGIDMESRIITLALVRGLRKIGAIDEAGIKIIADELRAATAISDRYGHKDKSAELCQLADEIEAGH